MKTLSRDGGGSCSNTRKRAAFMIEPHTRFNVFRNLSYEAYSTASIEVIFSGVMVMAMKLN